MSDKNEKSKRPADTPFKQQRLPAWQPILSPPWVIACFLVIAAAFIPIGAVVIVASGKVVDYEVGYGNPHCPLNQTKCTVWTKINIDKDMDHPVYMYYKLDNFYQNHRRYAKSRSDAQLSGEKVSLGDISDCSPKQWYGENLSPQPQQTFERIYAPCGLIAWTMFNDSFTIYHVKGDQTANCSTEDNSKCTKICETTLGALQVENTTQACSKYGIAWKSDRDKKFQSPWGAMENGRFVTYYSNPPADKRTGAPKYYSNEEPPGYNGSNVTSFDPDAGHVIPVQTDEDFMVWMRTASLPTFRKLYRRFDNYDFKAGDAIWIKITNRFNINSFGGHKYVVFSTTTWIGGKNYFLGISYVVVGGVCFLLALVFLVKHLLTPKSSTEIPNLATR